MTQQGTANTFADTVIARPTAESTSLLHRRTIVVTSGVYLSLAWLPYVGPLLGGVMGGIQAPNVRSAAFAALLMTILNFVILGALSGIVPGLWAQRWLPVSVYSLLIVGGALAAAVIKRRIR